MALPALYMNNPIVNRKLLNQPFVNLERNSFVLSLLGL